MSRKELLHEAKDWIDSLEKELERDEEERRSKLDEKDLQTALKEVRKIRKYLKTGETPSLSQYEAYGGIEHFYASQWPWDCDYADGLVRFDIEFQKYIDS